MERSECRVYSRFTATRNDGSTVKLRIQDLPIECQEAVLDLFVNVYAKEEAMYKSVGACNSEESKAELMQLFQDVTQVLQPHVTICCIDDDPDVVGQIAGASMMYIAEGMTDLTKFQVETKELKKLFEIAVNALYCYDITKDYNVKKYYEDLGIVVHPDFRKLGIANEIVKTRRLISKINKVPLAGAWMTAWGTQKAGANDNWETVVELAFDDLSKRFGVIFENTPPTCKYMIAKISE
ncbi:unnamed protein product [Diatraea saccharalis]|uniref:Uncharacterized protein n=1 Tax=Diatraea saccharalis TaxID=40085 RepID=A0A9N9QZD3_9NEOP|nr:unnamed protein product [Diatraea saccharalis]